MLQNTSHSHSTHLRRMGFLSLKIWAVAAVAVITALYFFNNFTSDSRAATAGEVVSATAYRATKSNTMNENGTTITQPTNSKVPSWVGTDTTVADSYLDLRMADGKLPVNAQLVSATLELHSYQDQSNPISIQIMTENSIRPELFDAEDPPSTREKLAESVSYSVKDAWKKDAKYSFDVTQVVRAWMAIPKRKDSSRITLFVKGTDASASKRIIHNYKTKESFAPRLVVTYKKAGTTTTPQPTEIVFTLAPTKPLPTNTPVIRPTGSIAPTALPSPTPVISIPPSTRQSGVFISPQEISGLPMSGSAWTRVKQAADYSWKRPNLTDQDEDTNVQVYAAALVFVRTGNEAYRTKVMNALVQVVGSECNNPQYLISSDKDTYKPCPAGTGARSLAIGRKLAAYVIAADLIDLKNYNPTFDTKTFRPWLQYVITRVNEENRSIISCHETRPNNWGTHCGATRATVASYLQDTAQLQRTAQVFKGWIGDRTAYAGFTFSSPMGWHADPTKPVALNPKGAVKNGQSIDGALPDDMRRGCDFQFPPCPTNYAWGALESAALQAEVLHRQGFPAWQWQDQAMKRAVDFLASLHSRYPSDGWWATGDDVWTVWLVNKAYGISYPAPEVVSIDSPGKNMSWTDWTHAK